jgi:hypothetical protein
MSNTIAKTHQRSRRVESVGIYPVKDGILFVPTLDMWKVHAASKPETILGRAGYHRENWGTWQRRHEDQFPELANWLYRSRDELPDGISASDAMLAFRDKSHIEAIAASCLRTTQEIAAGNRPGRGRHVSPQMIQHWLKNYGAHERTKEWFHNWLVRGEEPPSHVTVVSAKQIEACIHAWDYISHCKKVGLTHFNSYRRWLLMEVIPDVRWLKWLFGAPSPGFVVTLPLQRLRRENSIPRIAKEAGIEVETACRFHRERCDLVKEAIAKASSRGGNKPTLPLFLSNLREDLGRSIWEYARKATPAACLRRAKLADYHRKLHEAEKVGVERELQDYLNHRGKYERKDGGPPYGLLAPNFFIPTEDMIHFRTMARTIASAEEVAGLMDQPGFEDWFLDWVTPRRSRGKRFKVSHTANGDQIVSQLIPRVVADDKNQPRKRGRPRATIDLEARTLREQFRTDLRAGKFTIPEGARIYGYDRSFAYKVAKGLA